MYQPSTNSVSAEQYEEVCTATVSYDSLSIISDTNLSLITPSQTATGIVIVIVIVIFYFFPLKSQNGLQRGTRFKSPLEQASVTALTSVSLISEIEYHVGLVSPPQGVTSRCDLLAPHSRHGDKTLILG